MKQNTGIILLPVVTPPQVLMKQKIDADAAGLTIIPPPRVAIVCSSYYNSLVEALEGGAEEVLLATGIPDTNVLHITVPGAFEIPVACKQAITKEDVEGVIALGVIVQGETHHAAEIARACTDGLMQVQVETSVPIAHEVLYVNTLKEAEDRATGEMNKGKEAAISLLKMCKLVRNK